MRKKESQGGLTLVLGVICFPAFLGYGLGIWSLVMIDGGHEDRLILSLVGSISVLFLVAYGSARLIISLLAMSNAQDEVEERELGVSEPNLTEGSEMLESSQCIESQARSSRHFTGRFRPAGSFFSQGESLLLDSGQKPEKSLQNFKIHEDLVDQGWRQGREANR